MNFDKIIIEKTTEEKFSLPFSLLNGNEELRILFIILAIDPSIGGMVIVGDTGSGKTQFLRAFKKFKIPSVELESSFSPIIEIPVSITLDRVVGSLDIKLNYKPGILESVHNGYLLVDDFHLMPNLVKNTIINVWKNQENNIERSGVKKRHSCRFCLITTINSSLYDSSDAFLDKFAFIYELKYPENISQRINIIDSNIIDDTELEIIENQNYDELTKVIAKSRQRLRKISFPEELLKYITELCLTEKIKGYRADIALAKSAKALASFLGHESVTKEDIDFLIPFVLERHLTVNKRKINEDIIEQKALKDIKTQKNNFRSKKQLSVKKESPRNLRIVLERTVSVFGILIGSSFLASIIANLLSRPDLLLNLFGGITLLGLGLFLVYVYIKKWNKLQKKYGRKRNEGNSRPNNESYSRVKQIYLTKETIEEKRASTKEIVLDLEEDQSKKGKILRFMGLQARRGLISFTERQRIILAFIGFIVLIISIILYIYFILIFPVEVWFHFLAFAVFLFSLGFLMQKIRKEWRIRRAADIGASTGETSRKINSKGVGSHISPMSRQSNANTSPKEDYGSTLLDKLAHLELIPGNVTGDKGSILISSNERSKQGKNLKVIADNLPKIRNRLDSQSRSRSGKRAISITRVQSGRVIGSQSFRNYPRNIHVLATVKNAVIRQIKEGSFRKKEGIRIKLDDIKEKVFCSRVSATIIFVIDLSESIVSNIHSVSNSVNWLSRQAYLYRDRVGVVVLKGKRGVVIQPPTSNLNLVKRKLMELRASGATPLAGGLQKAIELIKLDRIRSKNESIPMIVLITDGAANIPLLKDPWTGRARETPLNQLKDRAYQLAIKDCLSVARQIRKEKIFLTIFNTNPKGQMLLERLYQKTEVSIINFLNDLIKEGNLFKGRQFMDLWSFTLLRAIKEITGGYLYNITRFEASKNIETLRIARAKMVSNISN
ncbi:MAG: VWA domain-containing protein [Candidatus Hodarchaeales archaeon]